MVNKNFKTVTMLSGSIDVCLNALYSIREKCALVSLKCKASNINCNDSENVLSNVENSINVLSSYRIKLIDDYVVPKKAITKKFVDEVLKQVQAAYTVLKNNNMLSVIGSTAV